MSILEKAYLKSLSQNSEDNEQKSEEELLAITNQSPLPKKDTSEIVSSRKGISRMSQKESFTRAQLMEKRLIFANMKDAMLLDRYRNLRTKLLSLSKKENFITLVTSVVNDPGSSLVAANLAATFALDEAKTSMLIEANILNPVLNSLFEINQQAGLIDYLEADNWGGSEILYKTGVPRLRFVPSGLPRENSAEYFTSDKMNAFIQQLLVRYPDRYPIIDAPSITHSADARILIDLCDKVILVVPYGKCTEEEIMHAALSIGEEKLAGIVLNQF
jgi:protein-tyrosine kinase